MAELVDLWDEVSDAVNDAIVDGEGLASGLILEHHFRKADLGVYRLPDIPIKNNASLRDEVALLRAALQRIADRDIEAELKNDANVLAGMAWAALNR